MTELWAPGWTRFAGEFYSREPLAMRPEPPGPIPVWVGGLSDVAFRRAARHDGWVGDLATVEEAIGIARRLRAARAEAGREEAVFEVIPRADRRDHPDDFARASEGGVTMTMTMPWMYYYGRRATLEQQLEGVRRYGEDVIAPVRALVA